MAGALEENTAGVTPETGGAGSPGLQNNSAAPGSGSSGGGFNPLSLIVPAAYGVGTYLSGQATNNANSAEGAANRDFASREAEISRDYDQAKTTWQATHGYQNAVNDMKAAGLNPAMMYAKSMSPESGSGGGPQASAPGNPVHTNALGQGLSSASQAAQLMNDLRNTDADIAMKGAQAINATANADLASANARQTNEATAQLTDRHDKNKTESDRDSSQAIWEKTHQGLRNILSLVGSGAGIFNSAASGASKLSDLPIFGKDVKGTGPLVPTSTNGFNWHLGNRRP